MSIRQGNKIIANKTVPSVYTAGQGITIDHNIIAGKDATYDQKGIAKLATEEEIVLGISESSVVNALQLNKAIDKEAKARLIADESIALTKLQDYLYMYESIASDMSYEEAIKYFEENFHNKENVLTATIPYGACSSIRNGNFYGRNYDWYYNTNTTFVVYDKAQKDKYEFLGVAQSVLDEIDFDSEEVIKKIRLIPYLILDGVNEHSVFCNTNVVPTGDLDITTGTHADLEGDYICQIMLPKYVLDHFTNATDAINWIRDEAKIFAPRNATTQLELHLMVGDPNHTYIVEFVHNEAVISEVTNSKQEVMTNFYRYDASFDVNGHIDFSSVTDYGAGLERYNLLVDAHDSVDSVESMRNCMDLAQYTKAYTEIYTDPVAKIVNPNTWKTEWAHDYSDSTILPHPMDLHANSPLEDYINSGIFDVLYNMYQTRSRETGTTWQTVHSSVYDIERKELYLKVQEENKQYHFVYPTTPRILQNIDEEVARAKAAEAGLEESKQDKLTPGDGITISNNNVISTLWKKDTGEGSIVSVSNAANGGQAIGNFSVAEGFGTDAKGNYSHTEGQLTTANGGCAHAEGQGSTAQGNCSHAEGIDTIAQNQSEHAEGQYNKSHKTNTVFGNAGNTIHSIGIGTGAGSLEEQDRRNAVEVMQNGDVYVDGIGNYDGADYTNANTVQDVVSGINDSIDDLLENKQDKLIASTNIQIAADGKTISATDTTYSAGNGLTLTGTEFSANVVDNITSTSSINALSANMGKELQDQIDNLKARGRYLSQWNATTGQPATQPTKLPYPYKTGDYYLVGTVGEVNYRPTGTSYTGAASIELETAELGVDDTYFFDGTVWHLQQNTQKTVIFASLAGSPYDNSNLAASLNDKVTKNNTITGATHTKITYDEKGLVTGGTDITIADVTDITASAAEINILDGITATTAELNYVDGVTSSIQTQLDNKQDTISDLETIRSGAALGATAVQPGNLATVATSGSYNDLSNKPTIPTVPTNVSEFTNDANYQTGTQVSSSISTHNSSNTAHSTLFNAKANDSDVVHKAGAETISGVKTFAANTIQKVGTYRRFAMSSERRFGSLNADPTYANWTAEQKSTCHRIWRISFPTGTSFSGKVYIGLTGLYSSFNASGFMSKEINLSFANSTLYVNVGRYLELGGNTEKDFRISEAIWNSTTSCWEILIYSHQPQGNNAPSTVTLKCEVSSDSYMNTFNSITVNSTCELSTDTQYINQNGRFDGSSITKIWADTPTYQDPYGYNIYSEYNHDSTKQDTLISGTNIKTINSTSLLGNGNIAVQSTITGGATTITSSNLTTSRALVSDSSGKVAVSDITSTELGYLDGVTSNVQTQLNDKATNSSVLHTTGNETATGTKTLSLGSSTATTQGTSDNSTKVATTEYINNKFQLVSALPASPDPNVWYAIPE